MVSIARSNSDRSQAVKGLAFLAICFICWAFSSPAGSAPDENWHVGSIFCAFGESENCRIYEFDSEIAKRNFSIGSDSFRLGSLDVIFENNNGTFSPHFDVVNVPWRFDECFRWDSSKSAMCGSIDDRPDRQDLPSDRDAYPSGYYKTMNVLMSIHGGVNVLLVRVINIVIFLLFFSFCVFNSKGKQNLTILTAITTTLVPLAMFIIPSTNPSSWSYTGITFNWILLTQILVADRKQTAQYIFLVLGWTTTLFIALQSRYENILIIAFITVTTVLANFGLKDFLKHKVVRSILTITVISAMIQFYSRLGVITRNKFSDTESQTEIYEWISHWIVRLPEVPIRIFGTGGLGWLDTFVPSIVPAMGFSLFVSVFFFSLINSDRKQILVVSITTIFLSAVILSQAFEYRSLLNNNIQGRYILPIVTFLLGICVFLSRSPVQLFEIKTLRHVAIVVISFIHMLSLFVNTQRYVNGGSLFFTPISLNDSSWWWHNSPIGPNFLVVIGSISFFQFLRYMWSIVPLKSLNSAEI